MSTDPSEMEARLQAAEAGVRELAKLLSDQAAGVSALTAGLTGLLRAVGGWPGVYESIHDQLERAQAIHLGVCINEPAVQELARYAELFAAALNESGRQSIEETRQ